jgi:hypothetical protein
MSQLAGVVAFLIILNASFPLVNSFGLDPVAGGFVSQSNVNLTAIQQVGGCPTGAGSCSINLGGGGVISTLITFGDFLWAALNFLIQIPLSIALPYLFLTQDFYAPPTVAAVYNIAVWVLFAFWINDYVAGRYKMEIP